MSGSVFVRLTVEASRPYLDSALHDDVAEEARTRWWILMGDSSGMGASEGICLCVEGSGNSCDSWNKEEDDPDRHSGVVCTTGACARHTESRLINHQTERMLVAGLHGTS